MRVFLLEQLTEMFKSRPCLYKAIQIALYPLKSNKEGHRQLSGSWNTLKAGFPSKGVV